MKRSRWLLAFTAGLLVCAAFLTTQQVAAQSATSQNPAPPTVQPSAQQASTQQPSAAPVDPFPMADRTYFTSDSPSEAVVQSFLQSLWGYDPNRIWRIEGIEKTPSPGIAKVVVYVSDKGPNAHVQKTSFYVMPDGKHAIADTMIDFGAKPYADKRRLLQERANGPALGPAGKDFLLVEFADLQCPHCKDAQETMKRLATDFPQARIVYQFFPLTSIHPAAFPAAAEGLCIAKQSNGAFFKYEDAVYATQESLTPQATSQTLSDAVSKAGMDPAAISACASTPPIKDAVNASIKLAEDAGVDQTPMLSVNGRLLPVVPAAMPYETLKKIILFQAQLDGIPVNPPPPSLTTLGK